MRFAFDTGGTFTDLALIDDEGRLFTRKVLSTPHDPSEAVLTGISLLLEDAEIVDPAGARVYGATTTVTNAVIERKGATTALITTEGFRDILQIRDEGRYDVYDLHIQMPAPVVPRRLTYELHARTSASGEQLTPVDRAEVERLARRLEDQGVESVAVCLLHSYAEPGSERAVSAVLESATPKIAVSLSSDVSPEIGEYQRASTTAVNAYAAPVMRNQIKTLRAGLEVLGLDGGLAMMASSGGLVAEEQASVMPVRMIESGPAAGVLAAAEITRSLDVTEALSFDMGGTTAKLAFIADGNPTIANEFEVARHSRFRPGSGLALRIRSVEMLEIGAGGGSIAHVDDLGLLQIGPRSAASVPGPACYGQHGVDATVTDADVLLGYISPTSFTVGGKPLAVEAAAAAVDRLAERLGVDRMTAASGIHDLVNEDMSQAALAHAAELGVDVRDHTLISFGGAGPVHAYGVARRLGIRRVIYPPYAGITSALGLLGAPALADVSISHPMRIAQWDAAEVASLFERLASQADDELRLAGVEPGTASQTRTVDLRIVGQGHEVTTRLPGGPLTSPEFVPELLREFGARYEALYGQRVEDGNVEAITWRLRAAGPRPEQSGMSTAARIGTGGEPPESTRHREVYFPELGWFMEVPVYRQADISVHDLLTGPLLIEQNESTIVLGTGTRVWLSAQNSIVAELIR